jgi:hypothetical protein
MQHWLLDLESSSSYHIFRTSIICYGIEKKGTCDQELCSNNSYRSGFAGKVPHCHLSIFLLERPRTQIYWNWQQLRHNLRHRDNLSLTWNSQHWWLHRDRNFLLLYVKIWSLLGFTFLRKDFRTLRFSKWSKFIWNCSKWNLNCLQETTKEIRIYESVYPCLHGDSRIKLFDIGCAFDLIDWRLSG